LEFGSTSRSDCTRRTRSGRHRILDSAVLVTFDAMRAHAKSLGPPIYGVQGLPLRTETFGGNSCQWPSKCPRSWPGKSPRPPR
jgi:hypothetical protein